MKKILIGVLAGLIFVAAGYVYWQQQPLNQLHSLQVEPPRPLTPMVLLDYDNNSLGADVLYGKWSYLLFADNQCDDNCMELLALTNQLGANQAVATQALLVLGYEPDAQQIQSMRQHYPNLTITVLSRAIWSIFTTQYSPVMEKLSGQPILLVGPRGMIRMGYDELVTLTDLQTDLRILTGK